MRDAYLGRVQPGLAGWRSGRCSRRCTAGPSASPTAATAATGSPRRPSPTPPTRCRSTTSCARVSRTEQELLRLVLLVPETHDAVLDGLGPGPAADAGRPRAVPRRRASPGPATTTASGRRTRCRRSSTGSTRRAGPSGQALVSRPGPNPRELGDRALAYEIERLMLELDDAEWQERSAFNRDAIAEAERDGDREAIDRLTLERRLLNEQRRSLDRRRDQTRLLARTPVAAG